MRVIVRIRLQWGQLVRVTFQCLVSQQHPPLCDLVAPHSAPDAALWHPVLQRMWQLTLASFSYFVKINASTLLTTSLDLSPSTGLCSVALCWMFNLTTYCTPGSINAHLPMQLATLQHHYVLQTIVNSLLPHKILHGFQ